MLELANQQNAGKVGYVYLRTEMYGTTKFFASTKKASKPRMQTIVAKQIGQKQETWRVVFFVTAKETETRHMQPRRISRDSQRNSLQERNRKELPVL
jgi:hypothetical protein